MGTLERENRADLSTPCGQADLSERARRVVGFLSGVAANVRECDPV